MLKQSLDRRTPYGTRTAAADALGRIAPGSSFESSAIIALIESLRSRAELIQNQTEDDIVVIETLSRFGSEANGAIPELKKLELGPESKLIEASKKALAKIANPSR